MRGLILTTYFLLLPFLLYGKAQVASEDREEAIKQTSPEASLLPVPEPRKDVDTAQSTIILSDELTLLQKEGGNEFIFLGNVSIRSGLLEIRCDTMTVYTRVEPSEQEGDFSGFGNIYLIEAVDNVSIRQDTRMATAGLARIYPDEGKIILENNPVVTDERGSLTGYRMILLEEEKRVIIESGPDGSQPRVVLPRIDEFSGRATISQE